MAAVARDGRAAALRGGARRGDPLPPRREVERLIASGLDERSAWTQARSSFGEVGRVKEDTREASGVPWLENAVRDARLGLRSLRRTPGFAASAVVTLGLGIGATTAIFSVVDGVLLEPLPYPNPDRLLRIVEQNSPDNRWNVSLADFLSIEERQGVFESVAVIQVAGMGATLTGRGTPEQIVVGRVSADWFRVLGVEPAEGRGFLPGEDRPEADRVVVISSALRDRVFGAGSEVVGASLTLDGAPFTVVGVLGPERTVLAGITAEAWPILTVETPPRRGPFLLAAVGRLRPARTLEDARADLEAITRVIFPIWADTGFSDGMAVLTPYPLEEIMLGNVGSALWLMLGAGAGVLLIAIANVGNLFMVRAAAREGEMALRASLGATRARLAAQLVVESLVIAALGGTGGAALAWLGLEGLLASDPTLPRLDEVGLDGSAFLVVAAVTLGSALLFGLVPLGRLLTARGGALPGVTRGETGGGARSWSRLRAALVTAEFAIAFSLATGAGLVAVSFARLQRVDPGYDAEGRVAMQLSLPSGPYAGYAEVQAFWQELLRGVADAPGVAASGIGEALPPGGPGSAGTNDFDLLDRPVGPGESAPQSLWNYASPGFFAALAIPLLEGRMYDDGDLEGGAPVLLVSESWARRYYPNGEVLGARLYAGGDRSVALTVVGIVGDVKYLGLDGVDDAAVYEPHWQAPVRAMQMVVRGRDSGDDLVDIVRREVEALDPELPLAGIQTMAERTAGSLARPRQWTLLLGLFALLGLSLASVGVYGVLSYYVGTQRREIGIRISLGAEPASVRRLVIGRGMTLALVGIGVGLAASLYLARWLRALVFGVSPHDPMTLAAVALGLGAVALLACALPARSATRIDPATTLKGE